MKKFFLTTYSGIHECRHDLYDDIKSLREGLFNIFKEKVDRYIPEETENDFFDVNFSFRIQGIIFEEDERGK